MSAHAQVSPASAPVAVKDAIALEGVGKRYGSVVAVDALSLGVPAGQFLTLLGPSGCGKTTTLRLIAGFEQPDRGRVLIDGVDMATRPAYRRPVNTVFQQYALFPHLSVDQNIGYGLRHSGVSRAEVSSRVAEMTKLMQIPDVGDRRPRELSGGQQQRVALARALVMRPAVLLLDEPLGSLDYKLRKDMQFELKRIHREVGVTFVYVTHDQEEAMTMSDRIVVMHGGAIEQEGSPEAIYDRPATAFVADFVGDTNLLAGTVSAVADGRACVQLGELGEVHGSAACELAVGDRALVSVRPGDVHVEPDEQGGAEVREAVLAGSHVSMKVHHGEHALTAHAPRGEGVPGARVRVALDPNRIRIFPVAEKTQR